MDTQLLHPNRSHGRPSIRSVPIGRAFVWLARGWEDMWRNPMPSLAYGLMFAAGGWVILLFTSSHPYLFATAISGFLLIAPLLVSGLYEISRRAAHGERSTVDQSLEGLTRNSAALKPLGLVLLALGAAWHLTSVVLFETVFKGVLPTVGDSIYGTFFMWHEHGFLLSYFVSGAVFALIAFCITAVSVPMIVDRPVDMHTAVSTSMHAVLENPLAMALWALLIVVIAAVGFLTYLAGLMLIMPWLAHATWHAYRDLVGAD